jgi:hypothetical protein
LKWLLGPENLRSAVLHQINELRHAEIATSKMHHAESVSNADMLCEISETSKAVWVDILYSELNLLDKNISSSMVNSRTYSTEVDQVTGVIKETCDPCIKSKRQKPGMSLL